LSAFLQLDAVTVKGIREGTALAIKRQREAANVKTVVATDAFGNPAANPGELLQRMSGITADIVGGEVRTVYIRAWRPVQLADGATETGWPLPRAPRRRATIKSSNWEPETWKASS